MSTAYKYGIATTARTITLDDYDALPDAAYRDKIEEVVARATQSEHVQPLLAPRGSIWPMDIFIAARTVLDVEPDATPNGLYFSAVSSVLCRALGTLRGPAPPAARKDRDLDPSSCERRAMQRRAAASVHRFPGNPLRVQVLRHMHLKWTIATHSGRSGSGYASDDSSSDDET